MSDLQVENIQVKIRKLDPDKPGFLPTYRRFVAARRGLAEFEKAQPEDIDEIYKLLADHMLEPENPVQKKQVIELLTLSQLTQLFNEIMGANTVNPPSGGD